ncbi:MAG: SDR family NAD(P)-dependent oxidoreductase [Pseudomonadota bacterium]
MMHVRAHRSGTTIPAADAFSSDIVLITMSNPMGYAAALHFARAGAIVAINTPIWVSSERPPELSARIHTFDFAPDCHMSVRRIFDRIAGRLGPVSVLINNPVFDLNVGVDAPELVQRPRNQAILDGVTVCATEFVRQRRTAGVGGTIFNVVETSVYDGTDAVVTSDGRTGLLELTQALADEWSDSGICVEAIEPGVFGPASQQYMR